MINRYEGDDWAKGYYTQFMKLNITNLKGIKTVYGRDMWSYSSRVSKLDGDPKAVEIHMKMQMLSQVLNGMT